MELRKWTSAITPPSNKSPLRVRQPFESPQPTENGNQNPIFLVNHVFPLTLTPSDRGRVPDPPSDHLVSYQGFIGPSKSLIHKQHSP